MSEEMKKLPAFLIAGLSVSVATAQYGLAPATKMDLLNMELQLQHQSSTPILLPRPNARYDLDTGIDIAIKSVAEMGKAVILQNVVQELRGMNERNDVRLPCSYTPIRKSAKREAERKGKVNVFEQRVKARISAYFSQNPNAVSVQGANFEPQPSQYKTCKAFAEAYATYKVKTAGDDIKAEYAKRIGGMNEYRRKMRHEAEQIWATK